jgi:hypothetical protein
MIPKTTEVASLKDYRPISLVHSLGKLLSKLLANRLATMLGELVHPTQGAFIKGRFIWDNCCFVQSSAKLLHARQVPSLLTNIDITRASDSVVWPFLLEVMQFMGFPDIWHDCILALLSMESTRIVINGLPDDRICLTKATPYHLFSSCWWWKCCMPLFARSMIDWSCLL